MRLRWIRDTLAVAETALLQAATKLRRSIYPAGHSEAEVFWTDFLRSLADRGLRGAKLVIADDH